MGDVINRPLSKATEQTPDACDDGREELGDLVIGGRRDAHEAECAGDIRREHTIDHEPLVVVLIRTLTLRSLSNTVRRMATLSFKVTPDEAARIRRSARKVRLTVSEFLRRRAMGDAAPRGKAGGYRMETSRVTGLPVMCAPRGTPPVTSAEIRALLADFP